MTTTNALEELDIAMRLLTRARTEFMREAFDRGRDSIALSAFHLGLAWAAIKISQSAPGS
jgi:hypothetical protein